jgi:hypothetical protein
MFVIRRLIILSVPALWLLGLELVKKNNAFLFPAAIFFLVFLFFAVLIVCRGRIDKAFWHFLILPILFSAASFFFFLFLTSEIIFHSLVVLTGLALYLILHQYFIYSSFPAKYQPYTLEGLTFYGSLFLLFFVYSSVFAGLILIQWNIFLLAGLMLPVLAAAAYLFFWIHKINLEKSWLFLLIILLIQLELFIAVSYLPTGYYVDAFILTIANYLMFSFSKASLQGSLNMRQIIVQTSIAGALLLSVLLTAPWG